VFLDPIIPEPFIGQLLRSMTATFIADYESLSTASWTSGTHDYLAEGSYNCQYIHHNESAGGYIITDPVRWSVYEPAAASDRYDMFSQVSGATNFLSTIRGTPKKEALLKSILPASGASHCTLPASVHVATTVCVPDQATRCGVFSAGHTGTDFDNATLEAILPATSVATSQNITMYAWRHRVNGTAVGTLQTGTPPVYYPSSFSGADFAVAINEGDTYEIDVWYKHICNNAGKAAIVIVTGAATGSPTNRYNTLGRERDLLIDDVIMSNGFDHSVNTYDLTFTGGDMATLLSRDTTPTSVTYKYSSTAVGGTFPIWTIVLDWEFELVTLTITRSSATCTCTFTPTPADYIATTTRPDLTGTQLWKQGPFDWDGTTTFEPWYRRNATQSYQGRRSGTLLFTDLLMPTSISVAYV
jgi:hypothetical protein